MLHIGCTIPSFIPNAGHRLEKRAHKIGIRLCIWFFTGTFGIVGYPSNSNILFPRGWAEVGQARRFRKYGAREEINQVC